MRSKLLRHFVMCAAALFVAAAAMGTAGAASNAHVIYSFTGGNDGGNAATQLVFDAAGNAYGTTVVGGIYGCGTVFRLSPGNQWTVKILHHFTCGADGKNPHGGVTFDANGNLFGTTVAGGTGGICTGDGCGVVFRISGAKGGLRVIYNFTGGDDGWGPGSPVIIDKAGNVYSTAPDGGKHNNGVVFQLTFHHDHWVETVLHAFTGKLDGGVGSLGALLMDANGNLFGVTEIDGRYQAGTAYQLSPGLNNTWTFKTIWAFKGQPDAGFPYGGLIADAKGNLYGTTYYGGAYGLGSVYKLTKRPNGSYSELPLYSFLGGRDGSLTTSTLVADKAGNLYGTTSGGGNTCDCGTIFKIDGTTGSESILHRFGASQTDGAYPYYGLTPDSTGNLATSTVAGGLYGQGTAYEIKP